MVSGGVRQSAVASMLPYLAKTLRSESPKISNQTLPSLRYTDTGFTINRVNYEGSLLIVENKIMSWAPKRFSEITTESLSIFKVLRPVPEILILGCGRNIEPINPELRRFIRSTGMKLEAVDSRNAASTYNILNEEGRMVAVALLPYGVTS
ncbi:NADH dehydrogenase [ubiquinone] 1 alpha subcomplex assembly factor 3 [Iris pallida]|uniref:NADH dehydrogenase [ubiquinone] 1 alpha subcomplex assembly factor 3 n=1 Tax=Iris pallida TaxID=29817 RepID=A0AAX6HJ65_IRIPA|nr:NADH dehydrogenase [ubiquinone] 1 alpha subcomplex assembly factor 3 [Iris pallida]